MARPSRDAQRTTPASTPDTTPDTTPATTPATMPVTAAGAPAAVEHSAANGARRRTTRLTADLPARDAATLAEVADQTGFNKVTTLVRAIRVLAELVRAENAGGQLMITYADGRRERLIIR